MSKKPAPTAPSRVNHKTAVARLERVLGDIFQTCGLKSATHEELVEAVRAAVKSRDNAIIHLTKASGELGELKGKHAAMTAIDKRLQARNKELADLLREADGIIVALSVLLPVGAHAKELENRKARANRGQAQAYDYARAAILDSTQPPPTQLEQQTADLGADALAVARTWRASLAALAATEVADSEEIPF